MCVQDESVDGLLRYFLIECVNSFFAAVLLLQGQMVCDIRTDMRTNCLSAVGGQSVL